MSKDNNSFGSFIKIMIGIGLAVLIFMSYMLAEQQGWVNTDIASRILRGVEEGRAVREAEKQAAEQKAAQQQTVAKEQKVAVVSTPAEKAEPTPAKEEPTSSDDFDDTGDDADDSSSDDDFDIDDSDDASSDDSASDDAAEKEEPKATPAATPTKSKKLDFGQIAYKRATWPKAVQVRVKGTKVPLLNEYGNKIGQIELPMGTRLFVLKVLPTGILEVKSASSGQVFQLHYSRTTFRKLYTGKPISDGLVAAGESESSSDSSDDSSSDESSDDSSDDDFDDDFDDDDFFDDDF